MRDKLFLDTNILVYLANEDSPYHPGVLKMFGDLKESYDCWISRQVLREYAVIVSRPDFMEKPLDVKSLIEDLTEWETIFSVADEVAKVTDNLKKLLSAYEIRGKRIHDANIVATMMSYGIFDLLTMDVDDFKSFKEIRLMSIAL